MRLLFPTALVCLIMLSPIARADDDLVAGKHLYDFNCKHCHGATGQGVPTTKGPKLQGNAAYWDFGLFKSVVMTGVRPDGTKLIANLHEWGKIGFMEPNGVIPTDQDLMNIQAYLKTLGPKIAN